MRVRVRESESESEREREVRGERGRRKGERELRGVSMCAYPLCHFSFVFLCLPQFLQLSLLLHERLISLLTRVHHLKQILNHLYTEIKDRNSLMDLEYHVV